ncbi:MAG: threonine/serine exporter family protein [Lactobacillaceae bacterium]|jgi:uncharacterized membrane protein YjjP (DUF1212 family)|nr:threonine/serine exporter family protein [Lactobacillaceae bacterium]
MTTQHETQVLKIVSQAGRILVESGAEISRVEQTMEIMGHTAGVPVNGYVTLTAVFASLAEEPVTQLTKTKVGSFNLQKVDEVNALSRDFVAGKMDFDGVVQRLNEIDRHVIDFNWPTKIIGAGFVSIAPMLLFKATALDLGLAFFIGIAGYLAAQGMQRIAKTPYIKEVVGGMVIALLAILLAKVQLGLSSDYMIVSAVMPLVPGVAITNSLREILAGHIISGLVRIVDALLIAAAIGGGVVLGSVIWGLFGGGL